MPVRSDLVTGRQLCASDERPGLRRVTGDDGDFRAWWQRRRPVISDGRLYVRNQDTLLVYDIKAGTR
jgi:hypothetical protein